MNERAAEIAALAYDRQPTNAPRRNIIDKQVDTPFEQPLRAMDLTRRQRSLDD
jgi:hypothetical protein